MKTFSDLIVLKLHQDKFEILRNKLIYAGKEARESVSKKLTEKAADDTYTNEDIIKLRNELVEISSIVDKLEFSPDWLFSMNMEETLHRIFRRSFKEQREFTKEIEEVLR
jgi:hypothetical protein